MSGAGRALAYWKARLGLAAWHIDVVELPGEQMKGCDGYVTIQPERQYAQVKIGDAKARRRSGTTLEEVLVHELLHVMLYPLESAVTDSKLSQYVTEHKVEPIIDTLAALLVGLRRKEG